MGKIILVLGGAVCGKTKYVEKLATRTRLPITFLATGEPFDDETSRRIENCQERRPETWTTVESPGLERQALQTVATDSGLVVDSLAGHVAHLIRERADDVIGTYLRSGVNGLERWLGPTRRLLEVARTGPQVTFIVSDEVGLCVVPPTQMARAYREMLGLANQTVAEIADSAILVVAGRAISLD